MEAAPSRTHAVRIASYIAAGLGLFLVLYLRLLPALLAGLLVYEVVVSTAPLMGRRLSGDRARVLAVALVGVVVVFAVIRKVARYHHLDQETGVLVAGLEPESPATRAGLQEGDILLALDGITAPSVDALHKQLTGDRIGERAIVTFLRGVEVRRHAIIPLESPSRVRG